MKVSPLMLGAGGLLALGLFVVLSGSGGGIDVQDVSDLEGLEGEQFIVLVYEDEELKREFLGASSEAQLVAVPADIASQWGDLGDVEHDAVVALDMRRPVGAQTQVLAPRPVSEAITEAESFFADFEPLVLEATIS